MGRLLLAAERQALCREKRGGQVVLTARPAPQHFHLRAGTDGAAAAIGAACVGTLVSLLNVAYDQASVLGQVDVVAICPHGDSIPVVKNILYHYSHPWGLKELSLLFGNRCSVKGVNFYKFSRKEEIFCHDLALQLVVTRA